LDTQRAVRFRVQRTQRTYEGAGPCEDDAIANNWRPLDDRTRPPRRVSLYTPTYRVRHRPLLSSARPVRPARPGCRFVDGPLPAVRTAR
jgi:hypothetical protein